MECINIDKCPVCGSRNIKFRLSTVDHFSSKDSFDIYSCSECGFHFTQNFPDENDITPYYEAESYISHSDTKKGLMNRIYHIVRRIMLKKKGEMTIEVSGLDKGTLLDIGCGTGYFLDQMKSLGWSVMGVEKSDFARASVRNHFNIETESSLDKISGEGRFDVITLWHVLEHLQNLKTSMSSINKLLKENGTLIVALPNHKSYDAGIYNEGWAAWDAPRHLWHFNPDTFSLFARKNGFKVEKYSGMPFDAFYVSMMSEKNSGNSFYFIRGILTGIKALLASINNPGKSSSVIYVLRKI